MDDDAKARAVAIGEAIQATVAAKVLAGQDLGLFGIGLDAMSTMMRNNPDVMPDFAPMLRAIVEAYNYVMDGTRTPTVDAVFDGSWL